MIFQTWPRKSIPYFRIYFKPVSPSLACAASELILILYRSLVRMRRRLRNAPLEAVFNRVITPVVCCLWNNFIQVLMIWHKERRKLYNIYQEKVVLSTEITSGLIDIEDQCIVRRKCQNNKRNKWTCAVSYFPVKVIRYSRLKKENLFYDSYTIVWLLQSDSFFSCICNPLLTASSI